MGVRRQFSFRKFLRRNTKWIYSYFDEVEHPMDFGTISANLTAHRYDTMEDLRKDINLVFSNCKTFNPPATFPWDCADVVEKVFKKEWPKVAERKLLLNEKRGLQGVLTTLGKEDMCAQNEFPPLLHDSYIMFLVPGYSASP